MRSLLPSIGLAALLAVSLAGKAGNLMQPAPAQPAGDRNVLAFLQARGFRLERIEDKAMPAWIVASRGYCAIRVADVSPLGWARDVVAAQADGGRLLYAFGGMFYADQPVLRTSLAEYRRRLGSYFGLAAGPLVVRAVILSPYCPDKVVRAEDAVLLSR